MKEHVQRRLSWAWVGALIAAGIGIAALTASAPPPPRPRPRPVLPRPAPAPRPWRKPPPPAKVVRVVPPLKVVSVPATTIVTETTETTIVQPGTPAGGQETYKPVDTSDKFASATAYEVVALEDDAFTAVLKIEGQQTKVRMLGIAPIEIRPPEGRPARSAPSPMFLRNLLEGESVYVVYDSQVEEADEEGRYVGYLYRAPDGLLINLEGVRQGFCTVDAGYDFEEKETFLHYQKKARRLGKGVWGMLKRRPAAPTRRAGDAAKPGE